MSSAGPPVDWLAIGIGIAAGATLRFLLLRKDYRHYPGYPAGYVSHIALGFFSGVIGAVFYPALVAKEYTAATFLVLAATNFTAVRKTEVQKLTALDQLSLVKRGPGYIQGIAQSFEERNYLAMAGAVATSFTVSTLETYVKSTIIASLGGVLAAVIAIWVAWALKSGPTLGDVLEASIGRLHFEQESLLYVDDVMLMEVGLPKARERYLSDGVGVILTPTTMRGAAVIWDLSQRQALSQSVAAIVGVKSDVGYPERTPLCRMDLPEGRGRAGLVLIPVAKDEKRILEAVRRCPVLENAKLHSVHSPALEDWEDAHSQTGGV